MTLEGIDVSTYQTGALPLAGLAFAFDRASYGTSVDSRYAVHAAAIRAAGLVLGAYHFWYDGDPAAQAATFLSVAGDADLLAIDLEGAGSGTTTAHAQVRDMIARLRSAGHKVGLYHSLSGYPDLGQDWRWVAAWTSTPPPIPWDFWQYRGSPLDLDRYHGDAAALRSLVAASSAGGIMSIYAQTTETGKLVVSSGVTVHGLTPGDTWQTVKSAAGPFTCHYSGLLHRIGGSTPPTYAVHAIDGPLVGLYIGTGTGVTKTADPIPPAPTQADLDAARQAGYAAAVAKAIAAVEAI